MKDSLKETRNEIEFFASIISEMNHNPEELEEGIKDWAKRTIASVVLAASAAGALSPQQAQAKPIVNSEKGQKAMVMKLASVVNKMVGNEYDVQVVQRGKFQNIQIKKDGKTLAEIDQAFMLGGANTSAKIFDKEAANEIGSGGYSARDAAMELVNTYADAAKSRT